MHTRPKMLSPVRASCSDRHFGQQLNNYHQNCGILVELFLLREKWVHAEGLNAVLLFGDWKARLERTDLSANHMQDASALIQGYGKKPICVALKLTCLKSKSWLIQSSALFIHVWNKECMNMYKGNHKEVHYSFYFILFTIHLQV